MNREIKFRIWDKRINKWWCEDSQYLQMDGKKIHHAPWSTLSCDLPNNEIIIQQFTGLKDANNKEIYEGDIVKDLDNQNGKVIYANGSFLVQNINEDFILPFYCGIIENNTLRFRMVNPKCYTIIGNIFENPELL